ncbi:MAG: MBL fold metallo-hydrolase, partial [Sphaerochaetaceae bacterium]
MRLKFIGGARTVTGSCTLIETENKKILVDCGLPQGNDEKKIGMALPFESSEIDYVLLTHAHIDHSGRIPLLVKEGFKGTIFSTDATKDLCKIMLADSGHIQEMETEWLNRKRIRAGKNEVQALYTVADAVTAIDFFSGQSYNERLKIDEEIEIEFTDAGHLLGSSSIQIWITENSKTTHLVFSGDIGNLDQPIVKDPMCIREADFVVMESTYGDRLHKQPKYKTQAESTKGRSEDLAKIIRETFAKGGNVVIPSFAVGRTQELLYLLRNIITQNMLPEIPYLPVFLDSPLAIEATKVFSKNIEGYFDREAMALVKQGVNPLMFDSLTLTVTA